MNTLTGVVAGGEGSCSDSSMVDEYAHAFSNRMQQHGVQIPLWSMNTDSELAGVYIENPFRFLYGR